jgi:lateral signaling target protein 2
VKGTLENKFNQQFMTHSDQLSEMFRPFRKLLIKMRDYLRTLNKNELFQLEKLLCTNEEISLTTSQQQSTADENTAPCCANKVVDKDQVTTNVTIVSSSNDDDRNNKSNENFYTIKGSDQSRTDDWIAEDDEAADDEAEDDDNSDGTYDNLATADCATGYLVPNTTLGNLLQANAAPLTYNIVESGDTCNEDEKKTADLVNRDSGLGTGDNGSLDQSPEQENANLLTGQYDENWENLRKIVEPSSSKSGSSSHRHHHHKEKSGKRKSRKHHVSSSDDTSTSSSASSSSASSPISSASGASETKDISRRTKFK